MENISVMKDWQRTKLDSCLMEISKDLDIRDTILKLRVRNIINADDEQLIMNDAVHKIDSEKRQRIVEIIKTRGERAYWAFCHIVKSRTPFIFDVLHKCNGENENVEQICPDCNGEENLSNCCNYCSGLVNVLSNPEFGVFVEKPEEIVEAFACTQKQKEALSTEVKLHRIENEKLTQLNQQLLESKLTLAQQLENKEKEFAEKQNEISAVIIEKEESKIEKEKVFFVNEDLKRKIQILITEVEGSRETLHKLGEDPIYANSEAIDLKEYTDLDLCRTNSCASTMTGYSSNASYKLKYETLEDLLKRQKVEHDRVFTVLEEKVRNSDLSMRQGKEELKAHKDYIKGIKNERDEAIKAREHLVKKLYEKDMILKETQKELKKTKQDKGSFEVLYSNQQITIRELEKYNEELLEQNKRIKHDNEVLKQNVNGIGIQEMSRSRKDAVENDEDNITQDDRIRRLEDENQTLKNNYVCRPSDTPVVLKKINDIFGIKFGVKKGLLLFGESRIFVTSISLDHLTTPLDGVKVEIGDYVILVNNENVEEADMGTVRNIISGNKEYLNLLLRKPAQQFKTEKNLNLYSINVEKSNYLGIRLAVSVILDKSSALRDCGLQDMDELKKINNKYAETLPISDIYSRIIKGIKQRQCDLTVHRYSYISSQELRARQLSGLNISPTAARTVFGSVSSDGSIESSPRPPMLPPRTFSSSENILEACAADQNVAHQYTENYASGNYQRIVTKEYDRGILVNDSTKDQPRVYENKLQTVELRKESYETFGLHINGGNKTGIYIEAVDNWKPAQKCEIQVGWRVLQINGLSLEKVAFCYAHEVLQKFIHDTKITFNFELTSVEYYKKMMRKRPYDAFHIESLVDYTARDITELSFTVGEILCVDDSYVIDNPNQPYKWHATKDNGTMKVSGFIPRQISNRAPSSIMEHAYEEIDSPGISEKQQKGLFATFRRKNNQGPARLYRILEPVGEVLV